MHKQHIGLISGLFLLLFVSIFIFPLSYGKNPETSKQISLSSPSFGDNEQMPTILTCAGPNRSPHLSWSNVPEKTKSFVLTCHDPDTPGGDWVHWIVYNIPGDWSELAENIHEVKMGLSPGINSFGKKGYSGPCPPLDNGKHHYIFTIYALDSMLRISDQENDMRGIKIIGVTRMMIENAMIGKVLGKGTLTGKFERIN